MNEVQTVGQTTVQSPSSGVTKFKVRDRVLLPNGWEGTLISINEKKGTGVVLCDPYTNSLAKEPNKTKTAPEKVSVSLDSLRHPTDIFVEQVKRPELFIESRRRRRSN